MKNIKMIKELQESVRSFQQISYKPDKSVKLKKCALRKGSKFLESSTSKINYWYPK